MEDLKTYLQQAVQLRASDLFLVAGGPTSVKLEGRLRALDGEKLLPPDTNRLITEIYELAQRPMDLYMERGDDDFSFAIKGVSRFRVSTYKQRGSHAAVIRVIAFSLPQPSELMIPDAVMNLSNVNKGMVLVTGPAGGGKSTTLACLIDRINSEQEAHIITLEDPLEFLHGHKKSIVSQREVRNDTENYLTALRAALRQSPDVILLGEMRDYETINTAMTAAETGHLIFSTLHTIGAANTIDRIVDAFPAEQQHQVAVQLSMVLQAVVSQRLLPSVDGKIVPAFEVMELNPAIRNLIREGKTHQIDAMIYSSTSDNMIAMDASILKLYKQGIIDKRTALFNASNPDMMARKIM